MSQYIRVAVPHTAIEPLATKFNMVILCEPPQPSPLCVLYKVIVFVCN